MNRSALMLLTRRAVGRVALPVVALLTVSVVPAMAQTSPTPEGTVITNTATVSFTDANTNAYTDASASIDVTVGFQGGLDVVGQADVQPAANTTGNQIDFVITNNGNGTDILAVGPVTTGSGTTVVDNISYLYDGTAYATLALLNAALASVNIPALGDITVSVIYDVTAGSGGLDDDVSLTVTSTRTGGNTDNDSVNVAPPLGGTVTITDPADQTRVPNPGGTPVYSVTFPVTSTLSGTDNLDLVATLDGTNAAGITIISVDGTAGSSKTLSFNFNQTSNITVVYTVANNAAGSTSDLTLTATAQTAGNTAAQTMVITIIKPDLVITKGVFTDVNATVAVAGDVLPGQTLYYKVTVTNNGTAPASTVEVTDNLPAQVTYVNVATGTGSIAWDSLAEAGGVVTAQEASLAVGASGIFIVQVTVK